MESLQDRRFVVIGAGGVGGWLLTGLSKMLEYKAPGSTLVIIDGDQFEAKNLERQSFSSIGNKAEARAAELQVGLIDTLILPIPCWVVADDHDAITDIHDISNGYIAASNAVREDDVIFAVVDNFATRKLIFEAAQKLENVDVFTGGNDDALYGSVQHYSRRNGIDILEHPAFRHPEYENPQDRNPGDLSCQERAAIDGGTQLIATNMAVASILLARVHKTVFMGEEDREAEIYFDLGLGLAQAMDRRESQVISVTN